MHCLSASVLKCLRRQSDGAILRDEAHPIGEFACDASEPENICYKYNIWPRKCLKIVFNTAFIALRSY